MSKLRIDVGASVDGSVATAFTQIEKAAVRAASAMRKAMADAAKAGAKAIAAEAGKTAGPYREAGEKIKKVGADTQAALGQLAVGAQGKFRLLAEDLKKLPADLKVVAREAQRALAQIERDKARAALGLGGGNGNSLYWHPSPGFKVKKPVLHTLELDPVRGMARAGSRFGMGALSAARGVAAGLAAAAGVELDWRSIAAKNFQDEKIAQQISSSGYMPGMAGPNGQLVSSGTILGEARQTAIATGTDRGEILQGLQEFVGKTGDLQLARDIMGDLAKLSRATGSSFADMVSAGAEVSNVLGDIPNKAEATNAIMRQIAGQGKLGAVEVRDLATQMAKIATQATKFQGGAAENIALLGVVAQEAKAKGGATNAAQATTAVARFVEEFAKPTVLKHLSGGKRLSFLKKDLNPYADAGHTQLKKAPDLITEILSATGGDLTKLAAVMPSTIAQKAIGGFAQVYNQTSGTDADKIRAVNKEFDDLRSAQLTNEEVSRAFAASMETAEAKAARFNGKMSEVVEKVGASLLPAMDRLSPMLLVAADRLGAWAENLTHATGVMDLLLKAAFGKDEDDRRREANEAQVNAHNNLTKVEQWEKSNLLTNAEGPVDEATLRGNVKAAQPVLSMLTDNEIQLQKQIATLDSQMKNERPAYFGGLGAPMGLADIQAEAKKGDADAKAYLADKQTVERLQSELAATQNRHQDLVRVLTSGAVVVSLQGAPGQGGDSSSQQPPNASHK